MKADALFMVTTVATRLSTIHQRPDEGQFEPLPMTHEPERCGAVSSSEDDRAPAYSFADLAGEGFVRFSTATPHEGMAKPILLNGHGQGVRGLPERLSGLAEAAAVEASTKG
jgi:hypothetical protein